MESKQNEEYVNEFVEPIFKKEKKHDFKAWLLLRKVLKKMKTVSPDFNTLFKIWELAYIANNCYMISYNQESDLHLFLGTIKTNKRNNRNTNNVYAMIYKMKYFSITFILEPDSKRINIEIDRSDGNTHKVTEKISFLEGEYEYKDKADEEKFNFMISCLMSATEELIVYLYKNKKF